MRLRFLLFGCWVALALLTSRSPAASVALPLEFRQDLTSYNLQAVGGVPISTNRNNPPGSNGQMPSSNESANSHEIPKGHAFRGLLSYGGLPGLRRADWITRSNDMNLRSGTSSAPFTVLAQAMKVPLGLTADGNAWILRRAEIGAPFINQQTSYLFGSEINPPVVDEKGVLLNPTVSGYWQSRPFFTTNVLDVEQGFYWSANAKKTYAIRSGPIAITWMRTSPASSAEILNYSNVVGSSLSINTAAIGTTNIPSFVTNGGSVYLLYTTRYVVSSSPVKPTRKIYWTEPPFDRTGKLIDVPGDKVHLIHFAFNSGFPAHVNVPYADPNDTNPHNPPPGRTNTVWYASSGSIGAIHAYNFQGRLFMELLGEKNIDDTYRPFGFEILDVVREPVPTDITVKLGERVPAHQDSTPEQDADLDPSPTLVTAQKFYYRQTNPDNSRATLYATFETSTPNDLQVHWLETGIAGLKWPALFNRYREYWPTNSSDYVHYVRSLVDTEAEAKATSVRLNGTEAPSIPCQDLLPAPYGAKLAENGLFYTYLDVVHPAHRSLLQFVHGDQVSYRRVFSWLDESVRSNAGSLSGSASPFAGTVATNLVEWDSLHQQLVFNDAQIGPRYITQNISVGETILPPSGALGASGSDVDYWAGYIHRDIGDSYHPGAYQDPFSVGFEIANQGAIIPVNAIPNRNQLEVWWFRKSDSASQQGFQPTYWPSVIGRYTIQWPNNGPEIILASNDGSGPLGSLQAKGTIYRQNDPTQPGYNPNEEHALMRGDRAYALRDDLNIVTTNGYTSQPYVLVDYTGSDGRPKIQPYKVRREKPESGIVFDYVVEAGKVLQAPMPLPLLEPPITGQDAAALLHTTEVPDASGDLPVGWDASQSAKPYAHYARFTYEDRNHQLWLYRGLHRGLDALAAGNYDAARNVWSTNLDPAVAVVGKAFSYYLDVSQRPESLSVTPLQFPAGLSIQATNGLVISGVPINVGTNVVSLLISNRTDGTSITLNLLLSVVNSNLSPHGRSPSPWTYTQGALLGGIPRTVTFTNRTPFLAQVPNRTNSFTMRFYYKNLDAFDWPGEAPEIGAIVPYLLPLDVAGTHFVGNPASIDTPSLNVIYRPVWPSQVNDRPLPTLYSGETLTTPKRDLPTIRDQSSVAVLYQQSIGLNITQAPPSVRLYDPTVQRQSRLIDFGMEGLPDSVVSKDYLGRVFFPNLPPHLKERLYLDPTTTNLVFRGQFVASTIGESYLLLNQLHGSDLQSVFALCSTNDIHRADWEHAVMNMANTVQTFMTMDGRYQVNPDLSFQSTVDQLVEISDPDTAVDSYALGVTGPGVGYVTCIVGDGHDPKHSAEPVSMYILRTIPDLYPGEVKVIQDSNPLSELLAFRHTSDLAGQSQDYQYDWRIQEPVDGQPPKTDPTFWTSLATATDLAQFLMKGSQGILALGDHYISMRYRSINALARPASTNWSTWTAPVLAEGWIKRVLSAINPFNQRTQDLFNNPANTTASIISQAGHRWEGDVALNQDTLNKVGLIEIYETVLNRGKQISINAATPINYGPANDALLLAAGYLSDLYMMLGNEAWADAANPTIGIGTADKTYGNIATSLFAFRGQEPSLMEEELALLRGRDDVLAPGVNLRPVYNRLFWNYTRGIDSGEVIYSLNYNILDQNNDGVVSAEDAAILYPQGHGDAYGHYLTALSGYYSLLMNPAFDWVPRIEAVTVLGAPVSVDYQDERKFATAAAAVARSGRQIFDLTWRQTYRPGAGQSWSSFADSRVNAQHTYQGPTGPTNVVRYWGMDQWATRVGQGAYLHWLVGNAILPPVDPDPEHQGIQKVDRTTVPELQELPATAAQLQTDVNNAEAGFTPLGLPQQSIPFDINPSLVTGAQPATHFEQVYQRAVGSLENAVAAFDDAQNVTQLMRAEEDSLANVQAHNADQEASYENQLLEIYGSPYPDDVGPGRTYQQDYSGPDLIHYMYVENPDTQFTAVVPDPAVTTTFFVDVQNLSTLWNQSMLTNLDGLGIIPSTDPGWASNPTYSIPFTVGANGFFQKPANWTAQRSSPGKMQQAISDLIAAQNKLRKAVAFSTYDKQALDKAMMAFKGQIQFETEVLNKQQKSAEFQIDINNIQEAFAVFDKWANVFTTAASDDLTLIQSVFPDELIVGAADGGNEARLALTGPFVTDIVLKYSLMAGDALAFTGMSSATTELQNQIIQASTNIASMQIQQDIKNGILALGNQALNIQGDLFTINEALRSVDDAQRAYRALQAQGTRLLKERLTYRQHESALIQGYRTRDAAFRIFRNERLERYKTLFDLAARYAFLAAQAYDYETGLLNTDQGKSFVNRIVSARALGVVKDGIPQFAGSNTGDPGLSGVLASMKADWDVLKGRLGFNNPDGYGTTISLRSENFRILNDTNSDPNWRDILQAARVSNLLSDPDVKRHCLQIDNGSGQPVPGLLVTFSTVIGDGVNLFGQPLAAGDHSFSLSSFATKIFSVGVDFDGYIGMDNPTPGSIVGGVSPSDPTLNPKALAATPYVYLIPAGADSMRSPPLGDESTIRSWNVSDLAIPLPFNISAADFSDASNYTSAQSLSEPLFAVRKHQAFRPVSTTDAFNASIYGASGQLIPSQYTNRRLIGRSVWNSKWKLVIPGKTLLNSPNEGLDRFIQTVRDIKLYFVTYSYAGN